MNFVMGISIVKNIQKHICVSEKKMSHIHMYNILRI